MENINAFENKKNKLSTVLKILSVIILTATSILLLSSMMMLSRGFAAYDVFFLIFSVLLIPMAMLTCDITRLIISFRMNKKLERIHVVLIVTIISLVLLLLDYFAIFTFLPYFARAIFKIIAYSMIVLNSVVNLVTVFITIHLTTMRTKIKKTDKEDYDENYSRFQEVAEDFIDQN